jgi:beta-glucanase (GH16 family)
MRACTLAALAVCIGGVAPSLAGCGSAEPPWILVAADEFDGPAGAPPDTVHWGYDLGGGGFGNGESQYYTSRPENVALDGNGNLVITARSETFGNRQYTSARIHTRGKHEIIHGKVEARLQLPTGKGMWPAFWLLGANFGEVGWPSCGEIDVMESRGASPGVVYGSLHGPGYSGGDAIVGQQRLAGGQSFSEGMHDYAVEWEPGRMRWSVDGTVYHEVRATRLPTEDRWVFEDHRFFVILNLAVGGHFGGEPDATTVFPQELRAESVRIYSREVP